MWDSVLTLFIIAVIGQMTPGPDMLLIIRHGVAGTQNGAGKAAYACAFGICCGLFIHISASILGLGLLIKTYPALFRTIQVVGALYLLYMGYRCLREKPSEGSQELIPEQSGNVAQASIRQGFLDGLLCNLLNPKLTLFIVSIFTQFVSPLSPLSERVFYGCIIWGEALVAWPLVVRFLHTEVVRKLYGGWQGAINRIAGVIFCAVGVMMLVGY